MASTHYQVLTWLLHTQSLVIHLQTWLQVEITLISFNPYLHNTPMPSQPYSYLPTKIH